MRHTLSRYLMTLLCMLAAGTWILPVGVIAMAPRQALAVPLVSSSTGSSEGSEATAKLDRSAVGRAWSAVTGQSAAASLAVIPNSRGNGLHLVEIYSLVHAESLDEAIDGSHLTRLVAWDEEASVDLFRLNADSGSEATVGSVGFIDVRLAAGTLHADGGAASRVFLALMLDAHLPLEEQGQPQFRGTQLVPIDTHKSVESARELVDMGIGLAEQFSFTPLESGEFVAEARGGSGGSVGLVCMNSNWVGTNGVQCCVNHAIYGQALAACWERLLSSLLAC